MRIFCPTTAGSARIAWPSTDSSAPPRDGPCRCGRPVRREDAADGGPHAERLEVISGDQFPVDALGLAAEAHGERRRSGRNVGEAGAPAAGNPDTWGRRTPARPRLFPMCGPVDEIITNCSGFHRQQAQEQLVDQRKDGGIGADAQGQRSTATTVNSGLRRRFRNANLISEKKRPIKQVYVTRRKG